MSTVFISGSIAIKRLPRDIVDSLNRIIEQNIHVFVGDADGVDLQVQEYCQSQGYFNVTVYSIETSPRRLVSDRFATQFVPVKTEVKSQRVRQREKDKAMSVSSDYSFVIWDCKSKGSYNNILRALEHDKKVKVFLTTENTFLKRDELTPTHIEFLYRSTNGYSAGEVVEYLKSEGEDHFNNTQSLNKWLLANQVIDKKEGVYIPMEQYEYLFIIEKYRGKASGIKFKNEFIEWLENKIKEVKPPEQGSMF